MSKLQRTIVLLSHRPTEFQTEGYAAEAAMRHWDSTSFSFGLSDTLPSDLDEVTAARLQGFKNAAGLGAVYLIVHNKE